MKIPLIYPKIPNGNNCTLKECTAFEKLDGTNIHFVWEKLAYQILGNGWVSFGTRRDSFSLETKEIDNFVFKHPNLKLVIPDFEDRLSEDLNKKFGSSNYERVRLFTEFLGANSFAGTHDKNEKQYHTIIDLQIDQQLGDNSFLDPKSFINGYKMFGIPKVVYQGKYTGQFVQDVRTGKYLVNEGVVCKGIVDNKIYRVKIKTDAYLRKLKNVFHNSWQDYWE